MLRFTLKCDILFILANLIYDQAGGEENDKNVITRMQRQDGKDDHGACQK